jgi:hypothetical protein
MQAVRAAFEQLRMDGGGPLVVALGWMSGLGLGALFLLAPVIVLALWGRARHSVQLGQGIY